MIRGVGIHTPAVGAERLSLALADLKVESVRDEITWDAVERTVGVYSKPAYFDSRLSTMRAVGSENVTILCYGNAARGIGQPYTPAERDQFAAYVRHILPFLAGIVKYVEIWNEWNNGAGRSAAQTASGQHSGVSEYVALCADVAPVVRSIIPGAVVLGGVLSGASKPQFEALVDAGIMAHVDAISCHPYLLGGPEECVTNLNNIQASLKIKNNNREVPFCITEMGWPTHTAGNSASTVAGYLSRLYRLCEQRGYIKGVWWYDLVDDGVDGANDQFRYGLLASDAKTPKPAYHAFKALTNRTRNDQYGWCRVAVTAAVEAAINGGTLPDRAKLAMDDLRSTNTPITIGARTLRVMTGPIDLAVLDDIGERFADDFVIIEGPVVRGQIPAQTTATRTPTWPNGW